MKEFQEEKIQEFLNHLQKSTMGWLDQNDFSQENIMAVIFGLIEGTAVMIHAFHRASDGAITPELRTSFIKLLAE